MKKSSCTLAVGLQDTNWSTLPVLFQLLVKDRMTCSLKSKYNREKRLSILTSSREKPLVVSFPVEPDDCASWQYFLRHFRLAHVKGHAALGKEKMALRNRFCFRTRRPSVCTNAA